MVKSIFYKVLEQILVTFDEVIRVNVLSSEMTLEGNASRRITEIEGVL